MEHSALLAPIQAAFLARQARTVATRTTDRQKLHAKKRHAKKVLRVEAMRGLEEESLSRYEADREMVANVLESYYHNPSLTGAIQALQRVLHHRVQYYRRGTSIPVPPSITSSVFTHIADHLLTHLVLPSLRSKSSVQCIPRVTMRLKDDVRDAGVELRPKPFFAGDLTSAISDPPTPIPVPENLEDWYDVQIDPSAGDFTASDMATSAGMSNYAQIYVRELRLTSEEAKEALEMYIQAKPGDSPWAVVAMASLSDAIGVDRERRNSMSLVNEGVSTEIAGFVDGLILEDCGPYGVAGEVGNMGKDMVLSVPQDSESFSFRYAGISRVYNGLERMASDMASTESRVRITNFLGIVGQVLKNHSEEDNVDDDSSTHLVLARMMARTLVVVEIPEWCGDRPEPVLEFLGDIEDAMILAINPDAVNSAFGGFYRRVALRPEVLEAIDNSTEYMIECFVNTRELVKEQAPTDQGVQDLQNQLQTLYLHETDGFAASFGLTDVRSQLDLALAQIADPIRTIHGPDNSVIWARGVEEGGAFYRSANSPGHTVAPDHPLNTTTTGTASNPIDPRYPAFVATTLALLVSPTYVAPKRPAMQYQWRVCTVDGCPTGGYLLTPQTRLSANHECKGDTSQLSAFGLLSANQVFPPASAELTSLGRELGTLVQVYSFAWVYTKLNANRNRSSEESGWEDYTKRAMVDHLLQLYNEAGRPSVVFANQAGFSEQQEIPNATAIRPNFALPVRSSDRRKLRGEILSRFAPRVLESDLEAAGWKGGDDVVQERVETSTGEVVTVYRIHDQPWWFRDANENIYPTVYTIWLIPQCCVLLSTHGFVMGKLLGGADLMLPGVIIPKLGLPPFKPGDAISINIHDRRRFVSDTPSLCVGVALTSSEDGKSGGMRGKGVKLLHWSGDWLWTAGNKRKAEMPEELAGTAESTNEDENEEVVEDDREDGTVSAIAINPVTTAEPLSEEGLLGTESRLSQAQVDESLETEVEPTPDDVQGSSSDLTPSDGDAVLQSAFLQALKTKLMPLLEDKARERELFPMSGSTFYSAYIQTSIPPGEKLEIAKTSFKKLSKFLKAQEKRGLLKVKEVKGEVMLMGINKLHPDLTSFQPFRQAKASTQTSSAESSKAPASLKSETIRVVLLYKPHSSGTKEVFSELGKDTHILYTAAEAREVVQNYVKEKGLVVESDPRRVKLDMYLVQLLRKEEQIADTIGRDEIGKRFLENMQTHYELTIPGEDPSVRKGTPPSIVITVERRGSNKIITKVVGMEPYGIDSEKAAEDLRSRCGTGTSVQQTATSTSARPSFELLVQGSKVKEVLDYLEDRWKVPFIGSGATKTSTLVEVIDKLKGKK
ncbi:Eukaryotic translation initiation factor 2D [Gonapodya sp. JEL0774]|nr:Eukaryotic translation initiation factor 2D [Gonapodya sp. JEL0774]